MDFRTCPELTKSRRPSATLQELGDVYIGTMALVFHCVEHYGDAGTLYSKADHDDAASDTHSEGVKIVILF